MCNNCKIGIKEWCDFCGTPIYRGFVSIGNKNYHPECKPPIREYHYCIKFNREITLDFTENFLIAKNVKECRPDYQNLCSKCPNYVYMEVGTEDNLKLTLGD